MAVMKKPDLKWVPDGEGGMRPETMDEHKKRIDEQHKKAYEDNIARIMSHGFTKEQAEYLYGLEQKAGELPYEFQRI